MNLERFIEERAFSFKWELSGMAWKAAADLGCLDEYTKLSMLAMFRSHIINAFTDNAFFARRR